jgi:hypothetical protein
MSVAKNKASRISRADLSSLPIPEGTRTHQPLPHYEIASALIEALSFRRINVVRDEYTVTHEGMRCFGLLQLEYGIEGVQFAIGFRNSNDKSMRLGMTVGYRVLACDNMALKGDFTPVAAKHSARLNVIDLVSIGIDRIQRSFEPLETQIKRWQACAIDDRDAKSVIYDAFLDRKLAIPHYLLSEVHGAYFEPVVDQFKPRTAWSLSNAFTSAFKELKPGKQFQAASRFGEFTQAYSMFS